jgi:hypothetical protein
MNDLTGVAPARLRAIPFLRPRAAPGSWTVHATVDEPTSLLLAFIAHYQALGADQVWLALDNPRPDQVAALSAIPGVRLTQCTRGYWLRTRGYRPKLHVVRQAVNATRAYRRCRSSWFLECDADEFLWPDVDFGGLLAKVPADRPFVRLAMAERVFARRSPPQTVFDGLFRLPLYNRPGVVNRVYGDMAPLLNAGITGHTYGKSLTRTGLAAFIWVHHPLSPWYKLNFAPTRAMVAATPRMDGAVLLHFDGMTPFHWRLKLLRKLLVGNTPVSDALVHNSPKREKSRQAQIAAAFAARLDPDALAALDRLQILPAPAIARLREAGGIADLNPSIVATTARRFPDQMPDLSVAAFDRALAILHADSISRLGLQVPG